MTVFFIMLLAIIAGTGLPVQAGVNASLAKHLGHPIHAAFISFLGGLLAMLLVALCSGQILPKWAVISKVHPVYFTGGVLGAVMVLTAILFAPRLGATVLVSCLLTGQLISSIILDHYGWVGFNAHPVNMMRIVGVAFLIVGVLLVRFFLI
jgi:transporter family-2 protein